MPRCPHTGIEASIEVTIVVTQVVQTAYKLRTDFVQTSYIVHTSCIQKH
jgi:hypothetical protein